MRCAACVAAISKPATVHAVVGPSGCGKSTLLYILGLLDSPDAGSLTIDGSLIADLPDNELTRKRNELLGFIFQFHFLLEDFTAQENVMIPMRRLGRLTEEAMRERAAFLLEEVDLGDKLSPPEPASLGWRTTARRGGSRARKQSARHPRG